MQYSWGFLPFVNMFRGGGGKCSFPCCVKFDSHPRQVCQDVIIVSQPGGEEHSNDLLRAMRKTMSSASLEEKEH